MLTCIAVDFALSWLLYVKDVLPFWPTCFATACHGFPRVNFVFILFRLLTNILSPIIALTYRDRLTALDNLPRCFLAFEFE